MKTDQTGRRYMSKKNNNGNENATEKENAECERDSGGNHISVQGNSVRESGNSYIVLCGDKKPKELTNFVMQPVNAIKSSNTHLTDIEFRLQNGKTFTERLDSTAFVSVQKFKTAIKKFGGIEMRFDGNEQNLNDIQKFMENKYRSFNHCDGLSCVGLHQIEGEWVYVGTDGAIDKKGNPINNVISVLEDNKALDSELITTDIISRKELQELLKLLFKFNTLERTVNIVGWMCGCFLKERLRKLKIKFPHLVMAGVAGSGKSETLEKVVQPVFCLEGTGIGCRGVTSFSMLKSTSSTNLLPIIYEEYKPHQLTTAELTAIANMLRHTYDGQTTQKGRADQSIINYVRRSPVVIVGESSFDEPAIKERIVDVQFAKSDRTTEHTKAFRAIAQKELQLNKIGKALLLLAMNISDKDLIKLIEDSKQFENLELDPRVVLAMSNVYLGILFLRALCESYHIDFEQATGLNDAEIIAAIKSNTMNSIGGTGRVKSAIDLTIQTFDTMALKNRLKEKYDYIIDENNNELCLRIKFIYDDFTKYVREYNVSDVEVLTKMNFAKQLKKESYYKGYDLREFKDGNKDELKRFKCHILDLKKVNEVCELEAFRVEADEILTDSNGFISVGGYQEELPFD
jgi:hypothetical protein